MLEYDIPRDWLTNMIIGQVSSEYDADRRSIDVATLQSQYLNFPSDWNRVFKDLKERDQIWEFDSPAEYWESMCGRSGIALVPESGRIVGIVEEMN